MTAPVRSRAPPRRPHATSSNREVTAGHTAEAAEARVSGMRACHALDDDVVARLAALWTLFRSSASRTGERSPLPSRP